MTAIIDTTEPIRMTRYARGGGCACKIPPGELEAIVAGLPGPPDAPAAPLLVGVENGDDAAVVRLDPATGIVSTVDFFTPVVDDPYDWGRIAAANALSDVYAMGGTPLVALNLLCWPRETLPMDLARAVLRGGHDVARSVGCHVAGGHSIDDGDPKYGMAVTGMVRPDQVISLDAGRPGLPLSLTKPLGVGVLNTWHKATGEAIPQAVAVMAATNRDASAAAVRAGVRCGTDVTGFGLLGHAYKLARASGVTVAIDVARVPYVDGARIAAEAGHVSGGSRRNLDWVTPVTDFGGLGEIDRLLLADAQTSGGLLLAGEVPGGTVIGELLPGGEHSVIIR